MDLKEGVAIFGLTGDPVHNGHVRVLGTITKLPFILDTYVHVTWAPEYKKPVAGFSDRVQMAKRAFDGIGNIRIVDEGFKYTSTLVKWLRKGVKCPIYLFTGAEWDLRKFHDSATVMKNVWQILIPDDCNYDTKDSVYKKGGDAVWLNLTHIIPCHSVYIRHAIENDLPIDGLVPQSVIKYIRQRRVYEALCKAKRNG